LFLTLIAATGLGGVASVRGADEPSGRQFVLLIAVQEHADPRNNLQFTVKDAELMARTLRDRALTPADVIVEMTDRSPNSLQPRLANLRRELPRILAEAEPDDRVILFFSGHGVERDGVTYLIPSDARGDDLSGTALPVSELSEALRQCRAGVKFLILDSCHSGGAKSPRAGEPASEVLAKSFVSRRVPGCIILASCRAEESSREWPQQQQGLFTYWLARALEGGGDSNGDGRLTVDEVYDYTFERVVKTAKQVFGADQTPVRVIGGDISGVPVVLRLRPEPPEVVCRRLAEHLDLEIRRLGLRAIAVLEFQQPLGRSEGLAAATLPLYCAEELRRDLDVVSAGAYTVRDGLRLGLQTGDVGDPTALRRASDRSGGLDALITGSLRLRGGSLRVQCELITIRDGNSVASPSGLIPISAELLAETGLGFDLRVVPPGRPNDPEVIAFLLEQAQRTPPLVDPEARFPFRVEIWSVRGQPGQPITPTTPRVKKDFHLTTLPGRADVPANQLTIGARAGETFEIRIANTTGQRVGTAVLVDGINSLGQRRERLGKAWLWVIEPGATNSIEGWYIPKDAASSGDFTMKRFEFTDVAPGVARGQGFTESIGLITVAFYEKRQDETRDLRQDSMPGIGSLRVGEGQAEGRKTGAAQFEVGRLLGVVQVRYIDERALVR
jgi:hypothetical protein